MCSSSSASVTAGVAKFDQTLTMVATLYKDPVEGFEAKVRRCIHCLVPQVIHLGHDPCGYCLQAQHQRCCLCFCCRGGGMLVRAGSPAVAAAIHSTGHVHPNHLNQEYNFKVQVPGKEGADKMFTVGKADIDMAMYANMDKAYNTKMIPIVFKVRMAAGALSHDVCMRLMLQLQLHLAAALHMVSLPCSCWLQVFSFMHACRQPCVQRACMASLHHACSHAMFTHETFAPACSRACKHTCTRA